jgi:hypothetical protein
MGSIWELDFYSRPILDENQKKSLGSLDMRELLWKPEPKLILCFALLNIAPVLRSIQGGCGRRCKKQLAMQEKHREESAFSAAK